MGKFFKEAGIIKEFLDAGKSLDWVKARKEFIGPSIAIGGVVGLGVTGATGGLRDDQGNFRPRNAMKGAIAGIAADAATGVGQALWKERQLAKGIKL